MTTFQPVKYQLNIKVDTDNIYNKDIVNHYTSFSNHHNGDSGVDLLSFETNQVMGFNVETIDFGIRCEMIDLTDNTFTSYYLYPRSSLSKTSFQLANSVGVIDAGYRGNIMAKVRCFPDFNTNLEKRYVKDDNDIYMRYKSEFVNVGKLDKGCWFQIVSPDMKPIRVNLVNELSTTTRDNGGFGSTNNKN
jgi:dUTP pyrophosphatase